MSLSNIKQNQNILVQHSKFSLILIYASLFYPGSPNPPLLLEYQPLQHALSWQFNTFLADSREYRMMANVFPPDMRNILVPIILLKGRGCVSFIFVYFWRLCVSYNRYSIIKGCGWMNEWIKTLTNYLNVSVSSTVEQDVWNGRSNLFLIIQLNRVGKGGKGVEKRN